MQQIALITKRADAFCRRLNSGLAAVAIVLAVITAAAVIARFSSPTDANGGLWAVDLSGVDGEDGASWQPSTAQH
jgi:hypothetical protein